MAAITMESQNFPEQPLFTCLSCSVAFSSAEEQRIHYRSDFHRYNMKRRVASLPPVTAAVFNQKVLDRRTETAVTLSPKDTICDVCNKSYTTENAYRSHMNSKKHKENEAKVASKESRADTKAQNEVQAKPTIASSSKVQPQAQPAQSKASAALTVDADATEDEVLQTIDQKIAAARSKLSPNHCLFCTQVSGSLDDNLNHMSNTHSFFIPDAEYLVDIVGLITYLGEKIAIGNVCIYCNTKSREFRTIEAVRKHMIDKSHCKIAYDHEKDRLEISDYYDFSSSYPDHESRKKRRGKKIARPPAAIDETGGWEDVDDEDDSDGEVDEIVDEDGSDVPESDNESDSDSNESLPTQELTYGDTPYELVLPSGARIGHRSLRKYYAQSFKYTPTSNSDPNSGTAIVRRLLADKNSTLVPTKGGFGAFGSGTEVVKARNRGEAREAGRHVREFRDQRRREEFKTKVGFVHNHQKHYRDPLLQ